MQLSANRKLVSKLLVSVWVRENVKSGDRVAREERRSSWVNATRRRGRLVLVVRVVRGAWCLVLGALSLSLSLLPRSVWDAEPGRSGARLTELECGGCKWAIGW